MYEIRIELADLVRPDQREGLAKKSFLKVGEIARRACEPAAKNRSDGSGLYYQSVG